MVTEEGWVSFALILGMSFLLTFRSRKTEREGIEGRDEIVLADKAIS